MDLDQIAQQVVELGVQVSRGGEVRAEVGRQRSGNIRFARNSVTTSGEFDETTVTVEIALGAHHAYTTSNQTDPASLRALVTRAAEMARLSPFDPEYMALLGPQTYAPSTATTPPLREVAGRAAVATRAIAEADAKKVQIAGFYAESAFESAIRNSAGLRTGVHRDARATYTVTARTPDGTGSGWGGREATAASEIEDLTLSRVAIDKAIRSAQPCTVPPGKYTVILEPQAVAEMMQYMQFEMDARGADEGRSFFTGKMGKSVFHESVTFRSNPERPFDDEGFPLRPATWIENGEVKSLAVSRYWGAKQGIAPTGRHDTFELSGGRAESIEELVAGTKRGLLVTRFWYNRMLEPQSIMITGLPRDGLFLVEDGRITAPVTNFRYNESPVTVLRNVEAMTKKTVRAADTGDTWRVPALRTREFTMASPSAAV